MIQDRFDWFFPSIKYKKYDEILPLPLEILSKIFLETTGPGIWAFLSTCKGLKAISEEKSIQKIIFNKIYPRILYSSDIEKSDYFKLGRYLSNSTEMMEDKFLKIEENATAMGAYGNQLLTGHKDGKIRIWSLEGETEPKCMEGHEGQVLKICSSGKNFVSCDLKQRVFFWISSEGDQFKKIPFEDQEGAIKEIVALPNEKFALAYTNHVNIVSVEQNCRLISQKISAIGIERIASNSQGKLAIATYHSLSIYNSNTLQRECYREEMGDSPIKWGYNGISALKWHKEKLFGASKSGHLYDFTSSLDEVDFPKCTINEIVFVTSRVLALTTLDNVRVWLNESNCVLKAPAPRNEHVYTFEGITKIEMIQDRLFVLNENKTIKIFTRNYNNFLNAYSIPEKENKLLTMVQRGQSMATDVAQVAERAVRGAFNYWRNI